MGREFCNIHTKIYTEGGQTACARTHAEREVGEGDAWGRGRKGEGLFTNVNKMRSQYKYVYFFLVLNKETKERFMCLFAQARQNSGIKVAPCASPRHPPTRYTQESEKKNQRKVFSLSANLQIYSSKMVATVTQFTLTATLVCVVVMLCGHGSLQMPTQARMKRASTMPCNEKPADVKRDLLLGLTTMYLGIFNSAKSVSIGM